MHQQLPHHQFQYLQPHHLLKQSPASSPFFYPPQSSHASFSDEFYSSPHSSVSSISRESVFSPAQPFLFGGSSATTSHSSSFSRSNSSSSTANRNSFSAGNTPGSARATRRPSYLAEPFFQAQFASAPIPGQAPDSSGLTPRTSGGPSATPRTSCDSSGSPASSCATITAQGRPQYALPPRQHSFPFTSVPQTPGFDRCREYSAPALRTTGMDASFVGAPAGCFKVPRVSSVSEVAVRPEQPDHPAGNFVHLDDGLLLDRASNTIVGSRQLRAKFHLCTPYFGDLAVAMDVIGQMERLLGGADLPRATWGSTASSIDPLLTSSSLMHSSHPLNSAPIDASRAPLPLLQKRTNKLLDFLLTQNTDLKSTCHMAAKNYSLILNKNGRLDIISFPRKSNLQLSAQDIIIIEGDRGKDLVMVLKPVVEFRFALFFNYLKKKLHLKSLEFGNSGCSGSRKKDRGNNNNNNNKSSKKSRSIINEDENFITLPNKQILRFAKPQELNQLLSKYNDELVALKICLNYASSLNLNLIIKNVEFQFDKKKLIIYYYCLQRLDFRGLIKELFKVYKTRIWLCAILPLEKSSQPLIDYEMGSRGIIKDDKSYRSEANVVKDDLPGTDQLYNLADIQHPLSFHSRIFASLIDVYSYEISHPETFGDKYRFLGGDFKA